MTMKALIALAVILAALTAGCTEKYGQPMTGELPRVTVIRALTDHALLNRGVVIEGVILTQCQASGCWFFLKDDTGRIFVNLAPSHFTLPLNKVGKQATVQGMVTAAEGEVSLVAKEVILH